MKRETKNTVNFKKLGIIRILFAITVYTLQPLLAVAQSAGAGETGRITNGVDAVPHEFPFMAALNAKINRKDTWQHVCGGTLVTKLHIITAANCFNPNWIFSVVLGAHSKAEREIPYRINVEKWHLHPKFNLDAQVHNIAVIVLKANAELNKEVGLISLPNVDEEPEKSCTAIGWGRTSQGGAVPKVLQKKELNVLSASECFEFKDIVEEGETCAHAAPTGICEGDSGGPLVCKHTGANSSSSNMFLFGVLSSVQGPCDSAKSVAAFTRVGYSAHLTFVSSVIRKQGRDESGSSALRTSFLVLAIYVLQGLNSFYMS